MRARITWLLVLAIGSMLITTALAECAAITMPCCSQHGAACDQICAAPDSNPNAAVVSQVSGEIQAFATVTFVPPPPRSISPQIRSTYAPSSENLLARIHVLLI
jgi:hypothetical protein